jgi:NitT/TauT family transport system permease protein
MPVMRPIVAFLSKWRFMGLVGFTLIFTLLTSSGHSLKVALMVFGMVPWFMVSFASEIESIPQERFDHARTLGMGRWRVVWEVVVLGKADAAFEILRQNAAMGWLMLTMVEGLSRSEGGLGVLLLTQNRHMRMDKIFAILITIFLFGLLQDLFLGWVKKLFCPYADLGKERK